MIKHKESISISRDACNVEASWKSTGGFKEKIKTTVDSAWSIFISGDLESDDPKTAISLLDDLQRQVEKIRAAYNIEQNNA
jgi:hypothetical protein